jgi:hypothetical protein
VSQSICLIVGPSGFEEFLFPINTCVVSFQYMASTAHFAHRVLPASLVMFFTYLLLCLIINIIIGQVVGRQRCPCNGSLWPRIASDCGGWWCDEWICDVLWCTYKYAGLADGDEFAFAASIALQAYFENRHITKADMDKCILYWRENIRETTVDRVRPVCCGQCQVPCRIQCQFCYTACTHMKRQVPPTLTMTERLEEVRPNSFFWALISRGAIYELQLKSRVIRPFSFSP